ncbi:ABC transporter substrate-binding protein [Virgibacillus oceani]
MKNKYLFFILLLILMLGLVGCGSEEGEAVDDDRDSKLIFAPNTDVQSLDPAFANDFTSMQVNEMIYGTLLAFDEDMNIVGDLAEAWEVSENGLIWTFKLREGVSFHDGAEFNAEAVKKSFDRLLNMDYGLVHSSSFQYITNVEVLDTYEITFETEEPYGLFEEQMAANATAIISPDVIDEHGKDVGEIVESAVGTGPYKITDWEKDEMMVLERNDDYYGELGVTQVIEYRPIQEDATRVMALEAGDVDITHQIPAQDLERLEGTEGIEIIKQPGHGQRKFRFDFTDEALQNVEVRQAILHAIDREMILNQVVPGIGFLSTSAMPPVMPDYVDLGEIPYDPEKSKRLLAEAGYPDGFETKITTTDRYIQGVELAEIISDQLSQVGIKAEINVMEWGDISSEWGGLTADEFDQGIFIMGTGGTDSDRQLRPIYQTAETNERNYGFYSNEEFDKVITEALTEVDTEKRKELYARAQEIVYLEDPASFFLYDQYTIIAQREGVKDVSISPFSMITFEKAYIEE